VQHKENQGSKLGKLLFKVQRKEEEIGSEKLGASSKFKKGLGEL